MPANRLARRRRRGLALFDVILAVGVVGVLIAGGVLLLQAAQERIKRNDTLSLINQVRAETVRIFAGRPTYAGLDMKLLRVRGSLPDDVIRPQTSGRSDSDTTQDYDHPYDSEVDIWEVTGKKQFIIGLADLDDGSCGDILSGWAGKTRTRAGIRAASVGKSSDAGDQLVDEINAWPTGNQVGDAGGGGVSPFDEAAVAGWCDEGDGKNDIYILFQG